jgi:hypothetical protein
MTRFRNVLIALTIAALLVAQSGAASAGGGKSGKSGKGEPTATPALNGFPSDPGIDAFPGDAGD